MRNQLGLFRELGKIFVPACLTKTSLLGINLKYYLPAGVFEGPRYIDRAKVA